MDFRNELIRLTKKINKTDVPDYRFNDKIVDYCVDVIIGLIDKFTEIVPINKVHVALTVMDNYNMSALLRTDVLSVNTEEYFSRNHELPSIYESVFKPYLIDKGLVDQSVGHFIMLISVCYISALLKETNNVRKRSRMKKARYLQVLRASCKGMERLRFYMY